MFTVVKYLIMSAGLWKLEIEEKLKLPYKIWQFYMICIYALCSIGIPGNFLYVLIHDPDRAIEAMGVAISYFTCIIKMRLCVKPKITQLLQIAVQDDEAVSNEDPTLSRMIYRHKKSLSMTGLFIIFYSFTFCAHMSIYGGLVEYRSYQMKFPNATEKPEYVLCMWFPFDVQKYFDFALGLQCFLLIQVCSGNYASLILFNTMMVYVVIKLKLLKFYFKNFDKYPQEIHFNDPAYRNKMAVRNLERIIKKHQFIIRFMQDLNECMKTALLIEYSMSSLMLASIILQIMNGNRIEIFIPYAMVLVFQLFLLSWNAEEIKTQSGDIAFAIYECDWYNYNAKVHKLIFMIVMRARRELTLNIGPFGPNNINAARARLQLAYSYLSVMSGNTF